MTETQSSLLPLGRYRYITENNSCVSRRRPVEKSRLPAGVILLFFPGDKNATLCWPQMPAVKETSATTIALCFDKSVQLILEGDSVENGFDRQQVLSVLQGFLSVEHFPAVAGRIDCLDSTHEHVSMRTTPKSGGIDYDSGAVVSFRTCSKPLLSISLIRMDDSDESTDGSSLQQACLKRQLVGCHIAFKESCMTTEISVPFLGKRVDFRVVSILSTPANSPKKREEPILYIIMPSTRITIIRRTVSNNEGSAASGVKDLLHRPRTVSSTNLSPTAKLLVETVNCIRSDNSSVTRTFLLSGPPGVGKTFSVRMAFETSDAQGPTKLVSLQGSELLSSSSHPSEAIRSLRRCFQKTAQFCQGDSHVGMVFIDECEALLSSQAVAATLAGLLDCITGSTADQGWKKLIVVAATNRIDSVPSWLRRPGRLDREIAMGPPNATERKEIIRALLKQSTFPSSDNDDFGKVAEACVGYVPADLAALVRQAALLAFREGKDYVTAELLRNAMADVGASALRDAALCAPPKTTWDDIAGDAGGAKTALQRAIEWPHTKKQAFLSLGLAAPRGILLHGPPGCAKTTLARAAAGAAQIAFLSLSPADVYASSYVGEAEAVVRRAFTLARSASPCILFFDEIDSILGCESDSSHGMGRRSGKTAEARVLSTFLNEMDGVDASQNDGVLVLGATNRPTTLDAALLRPGRFDRIIYVPPPDEAGRRALLQKQCDAWKCATSKKDESEETSYVDVDLLAKDDVTGLMTGAEILGACREAAMRVLRERTIGENDGKMQHSYLENALKSVKPLLSDEHFLEEYSAFEAKRSLL